MTTTAETEDAIVRSLATIRRLWPVLMVESTGSGQAGSTDEVTALDRRISLRHEVTLTLNGWARVIVDDRDLSHGLPLGTDTIGLCVLIDRHANWLSGHEAGEDVATELTEAAREVKAAALPQRREWMPLGTCPLETEPGEVCGGDVRAYPERDPYCVKCGTEAVATWWERVMFPDAEVSELVTADDLVLVLHRAFGGTPVKPTTIRQWIRRGVIVSSGKDEKGRRLYDRGAVIFALSRGDEVAR